MFTLKDEKSKLSEAREKQFSDGAEFVQRPAAYRDGLRASKRARPVRLGECNEMRVEGRVEA